MSYQPITYRSVALSNYSGVTKGAGEAVRSFNNSLSGITDTLDEQAKKQDDDLAAGLKLALNNRTVDETQALLNNKDFVSRYGAGNQAQIQGILGGALQKAQGFETDQFNYERANEDRIDAPLLDILNRDILEGNTTQDMEAYQRYLDAGGSVRGAAEVLTGINQEKQTNTLTGHEQNFLENRYQTGGDAAVTKAAKNDYINEYIKLNKGNSTGAEESWNRAFTNEKDKYKIGEIAQGELDKKFNTFKIRYETETGTQKAQLDAANALFKPDAVLSDDEIAKQLTDVLVAADGKSEDWGLNIKGLISDAWKNKSVSFGGKNVDISGVRPADFMYAAQAAADKGDEAKWYRAFISIDGEVDEEKFKAALIQRAVDRKVHPDDVSAKEENAALLAEFNQRNIDKEATFDKEKLRLESEYKADPRNSVRSFGVIPPQAAANALRDGNNNPAVGNPDAEIIRNSTLPVTENSQENQITNSDVRLNAATNKYNPDNQIRNTAEFLGATTQQDREVNRINEISNKKTAELEQATTNKIDKFAKNNPSVLMFPRSDNSKKRVGELNKMVDEIAPAFMERKIAELVASGKIPVNVNAKNFVKETLSAEDSPFKSIATHKETINKLTHMFKGLAREEYKIRQSNKPPLIKIGGERAPRDYENETNILGGDLYVYEEDRPRVQRENELKRMGRLGSLPDPVSEDLINGIANDTGTINKSISLEEAQDNYVKNYYTKSNLTPIENKNIQENMVVVDQGNMPNQDKFNAVVGPAAEAFDIDPKQLLYTVMAESSGKTGIVDHGNNQTIGSFGLQKKTIKSLINQDNGGKIFGDKSKAILNKAGTSIEAIAGMNSVELTNFFSHNLDVAALFAAAVYGTRK